MASSVKNPKMEQPTNVIDESLTDFKKIATQLPNSLVDKTELIHIFCTQARTHELITAPPRFGKSVNLSMFRSFFEIEVDPATGRLKTQLDPKTQAITDTENYRLFADLNLAIMMYPETVTKYLGRHPVLALDFKCESDIETVDDALELCRTVISTSFRQHPYLLVSEKLTDNERAVCDRWCADNTFMTMNPRNGVVLLVEFLYKHFERDVVFLVDEYDALVVRALVAATAIVVTALDAATANSFEEACKSRRVDYPTAHTFLNIYYKWMEELNLAYNIDTNVAKALINANQERRERICGMNGIDLNEGQILVDDFNQNVLSISNISSIDARVLITAHESSIQNITAHEDNLQKISRKPVDMIAALLKTSNTNIHLLKSLVTGVSYIAGIGWSGIANNITPSKFTEYHQFNRFYGFQFEEVEGLLEKLGTPGNSSLKKEEILDLIERQYNGYEYPAGDSGTKIYCPWSVLKYLRTGVPGYYWAGAAYTEPLEHMFLNKHVFIFLQDLLENKDTMDLRSVDKLKATDLVKLQKCVKGNLIRDSHVLFLNFILELGYLTVVSVTSDTPKYYSVKIPNLEVKTVILQLLTDYYASICSEEFIKNATMKSENIFDRIDSAAKPTSSDEKFEEALRRFKQELQTLFQQYLRETVPKTNELIDESQYLRESVPNTNEFINESSLHCFMGVIFATGGIRSVTEHYVQTSDSSKGRLDVLVVKDEFALLIELKYFPKSKKTSDEALKQILDKKYFKAFEHPKFSKFERHILMGLCVSEDNRMAISAIRNHKEGTNSVTINIPFDE